MAGLNLDTPQDTHGFLTINSVPMHTQAWYVLDCLPLWVPQTQPRGQSLVVPNSAGRMARRRRRDEQRYSLPMLISGEVDQAGVVAADKWVQLVTNVLYLQENIVDASYQAPVNATLELADGVTYGSNCIVENIVIGEHLDARAVRTTLELVLPFGKFDPDF